MKFSISLATLAISTFAAAHCMKKGQELSATLATESSDEMLPGSNLVYYCFDEDMDSNISIDNLDVYPELPTAEEPLQVSVTGTLRKPLDPESYIIFRDVVTGQQLNPGQIKLCPFLESLGHSCPTKSLQFHWDLEFTVGSLLNVETNDIYIELYEPAGDKIICVKSPYYNNHDESHDMFMEGVGAIDL